MRFSSGTAAGLLLAFALLGAADGRALLQSNAPICSSKPPNGTWVVEHFTPTVPESPDLTRHARSVLFMNEVEDNFYIGDGNGVYFLEDILDLYNGTLWDYHMALLFDAESCMLSGTVFSLREPGVYPDAAEYFYDGETFSGLFLFPIPTESDSRMLRLFPQIARHEGTYLGDP